MHQPPSAYIITGPSAKYSEKNPQLPSYVFSTVKSIIPSQQPTLSPSGLPTEMPIITPSTTTRRYPTQSTSNKPSWL